MFSRRRQRAKRMDVMVAQRGLSLSNAEDYFVSDKMSWDPNSNFAKCVAAEDMGHGTLLLSDKPRLLYPNFLERCLETYEYKFQISQDGFPPQLYCVCCLDLIDNNQTVSWCEECKLPCCLNCGPEHTNLDRICYFTKISKARPTRADGSKSQELTELYLDVTLARFVMMQATCGIFKTGVDMVIGESAVQCILYDLEERMGHVLNREKLPLSFFAAHQKRLPVLRAYAILAACGNTFDFYPAINLGVFHPIVAKFTRSCKGNVEAYISEMGGVLEIRTTAAVTQGELLCLDFVDQPLLPTTLRQRLVASRWVCQCECSLCIPYSEQTMMTSAITFDYNAYYESSSFHQGYIEEQRLQAHPQAIEAGENAGGSGDAPCPLELETIFELLQTAELRETRHAHRASNVHAQTPNVRVDNPVPHVYAGNAQVGNVPQEPRTRHRSNRPLTAIETQQLRDIVSARLAETAATRYAAELQSQAALRDANAARLPNAERPVVPSPAVPPEAPSARPRNRRNLLMEAVHSPENEARLKLRQERNKRMMESKQQKWLPSTTSAPNLTTSAPECPVPTPELERPEPDMPEQDTIESERVTSEEQTEVSVQQLLEGLEANESSDSDSSGSPTLRFEGSSSDSGTLTAVNTPRSTISDTTESQTQ